MECARLLKSASASMATREPAATYLSVILLAFMVIPMNLINAAAIKVGRESFAMCLIAPKPVAMVTVLTLTFANATLGIIAPILLKASAICLTARLTIQSVSNAM